MKTIIAALISIALVGCATPADLRKKTPDLQLSSQKSAKDVSICITDKWEATPLQQAPVSMRESQNGYSIKMMCMGNTCLMGDVLNEGSGSRTSLYTNGLALGGYLTDAKDCQ